MDVAYFLYFDGTLKRHGVVPALPDDIEILFFLHSFGKILNTLNVAWVEHIVNHGRRF